MSHNDNSEFLKALLEYQDKKMNQSVDVEMDSDCQKESFEFNQSMEYLFRNGRLPKGYISRYKQEQRIRQCKKVTSVVAFLALLCLGFIKQPATAIQMPIINIKEQWQLDSDKVILIPELSSNVKNKNEIDTYYCPGWLPKGYTLKEEKFTPIFGYFAIYVNKDGDYICFHHSSLDQIENMSVTRDKCRSEIEDGIFYFMFESEEYSMLYWADENGQYTLNGRIDLKVLKKMAKSLTILE